MSLREARGCRRRQRFAAIVLLAGAAACTTDHVAPSAPDAAAAGDASSDAGREPLETDGSALDMDGGRDLGPDRDADTESDASPDAAEAGANAGPLWPDVTPLQPSLAAFEATACRIYYDERSDGTDDRGWGFEYDANDRLVQRLDWVRRPSASDTFDVVLFASDGRIIAHRGGRSRFEYPGDGVVVIRDYHGPPPNDRPTVSLTELHYDAAGKLSYLSEESTTLVPDSFGNLNPYSWRRAWFENGVVTRFHENEGVDNNTASGTFGPQGLLVSCSGDYDPEQVHSSCTEDGWELEASYSEGVPGSWRTTYTRDESGRITASTTTGMDRLDDELIVETYTGQWIWGAGGGFVDIQLSDDTGTFMQNFRVVIAAGETGREHDAAGNLLRVHVDEDGDGAPDVTHTYRHEGEGSCRDGGNPQFDAQIMRTPQVPNACRFSPLPPGRRAFWTGEGDHISCY